MHTVLPYHSEAFTSVAAVTTATTTAVTTILITVLHIRIVTTVTAFR